MSTHALLSSAALLVLALINGIYAVGLRISGSPGPAAAHFIVAMFLAVAVEWVSVLS